MATHTCPLIHKSYYMCENHVHSCRKLFFSCNLKAIHLKITITKIPNLVLTAFHIFIFLCNSQTGLTILDCNWINYHGQLNRGFHKKWLRPFYLRNNVCQGIYGKFSMELKIKYQSFETKNVSTYPNVHLE